MRRICHLRAARAIFLVAALLPSAAFAQEVSNAGKDRCAAPNARTSPHTFEYTSPNRRGRSRLLLVVWEICGQNLRPLFRVPRYPAKGSRSPLDGRVSDLSSSRQLRNRRSASDSCRRPPSGQSFAYRWSPWSAAHLRSALDPFAHSVPRSDPSQHSNPPARRPPTGATLRRGKLRTQHGGDRSSSFLSPCAESAKPKRAGLVIAYGVVLPLGFAAPGAYRLQESGTYINFSTSIGTSPLNRHFPDNLQFKKYCTTVPPPSERHPFRRHPMA